MSTAARFHALHAGPDVLVLPNAWDAASAALMQDAGARAVATSSAAVAWARGYADGDLLPLPVLLDVIGGIARVLTAPLTADIEGGFTDDLATLGDTIAAVIDAGAVGINLEDGGRDPDLHARKIAAARTAADARGVDLFINARTDVYLRDLARGEAALAETLRRAALYQSAGASGVFVPGPVEPDLIAELARGIALPLNIMGRAGAPDAARLAQLGVRRLSSATGPFRAAYGTLNRLMAGFLASGDANLFVEPGQGMPDLNARFG
ncbi:MAG: isocitrate lyase/phosphoenolpyruvate mutase family protein [Caulobacter sp.]|nr:isocitrate lyase/phosphoenolpyruvate mutase family protein [Caulobacter sp.]